MTFKQQKKCRKCGETKPLEEFSKRNDRPDGRRTECKTCAAEHARNKYAENPEAERDRKRAERAANPGRDAEQSRQRRAANPEKSRAQKRAWKAANPEKVRNHNRRYRQNNLEKVKTIQHRWYKVNYRRVSLHQRNYRQANPEKIKAKNQAYYISNPDAFRAYQHNRRTRLKNNGGSCTGAQLRELRIAQNHQCAYCKRRVNLNIDHIFPVKRGGSSDISNICWACRRCNLNKGAKTLDEWVDRWYEHHRLY